MPAAKSYVAMNIELREHNISCQCFYFTCLSIKIMPKNDKVMYLYSQLILGKKKTEMN